MSGLAADATHPIHGRFVMPMGVYLMKGACLQAQRSTK
jgi:hypothetical protein